MNTVLMGVDTLEVGYSTNGYKLSSVDWQLLDDAKREANEDKGDVTYFLGGQEFALSYQTPKRYDYYLHNGHIQVTFKRIVNGGKNYPEIHVKYLSEYLWDNGYDVCSQNVRKWLGEWCHISGETVSRIDICRDVETTIPTLTVNEFVTRALSKTAYELTSYTKGTRNLGYSIGKGDIRFRIYDKTQEVGQSGKTWFYNLWGSGGWQGSDVTRCEFQLRRDYLRQYSLNTVNDITKQLPAVWSALTQKWLRICVPSATDTNKGRWVNSELWQEVVKAPEFTEPLQKNEEVSYNKARLVSMVRGCLLNLNAHNENPALIVKEIIEDKEYKNELATRKSRIAKLVSTDYEGLNSSPQGQVGTPLSKHL